MATESGTLSFEWIGDKGVTAAESVDIKEGTTGAQIVGNTFDGSGLTGVNYDDSWVDVKGDNVLVQDNTGRNTTNDGYQTHTQQSGWGCGTVFRNNKSTLTGATGSTQLAINVTNYGSGCRTTVYGSNTAPPRGRDKPPPGRTQRAVAPKKSEGPYLERYGPSELSAKPSG